MVNSKEPNFETPRLSSTRPEIIDVLFRILLHLVGKLASNSAHIRISTKRSEEKARLFLIGRFLYSLIVLTLETRYYHRGKLITLSSLTRITSVTTNNKTVFVGIFFVKLSTSSCAVGRLLIDLKIFSSKT